MKQSHYSMLIVSLLLTSFAPPASGQETILPIPDWLLPSPKPPFDPPILPNPNPSPNPNPAPNPAPNPGCAIPTWDFSEIRGKQATIQGALGGDFRDDAGTRTTCGSDFSEDSNSASVSGTARYSRGKIRGPFIARIQVQGKVEKVGSYIQEVGNGPWVLAKWDVVSVNGVEFLHNDTSLTCDAGYIEKTETKEVEVSESGMITASIESGANCFDDGIYVKIVDIAFVRWKNPLTECNDCDGRGGSPVDDQQNGLYVEFMSPYGWSDPSYNVTYYFERASEMEMSRRHINVIKTSDAIEVIESQEGDFLQVKTPDHLLHFREAEAGKRLQAEFYRLQYVGSQKDGNGLWPISSNAVWDKQVDLNSLNYPTNHNRIGTTMTMYGVRTNLYISEYAESDLGWTHINPSDNSVAYINTTNQTGNRVLEKLVLDAAGIVRDREITEYGSFSWGEAPVVTVNGTNGAVELAVTNNITYWTTLGADGYGQIKTLTNSLGQWWSFDWEGTRRRTRVMRGWMNEPATSDTNKCLVHEYSYSPIDQSDNGSTQPDHPRRVMVGLLGKPVGRSDYIITSTSFQEKRFGDPADASASGANYESKTTYLESGEIKTVNTQDGQRSVFWWSTNGDYKISVELHGEKHPTSETNVSRGILIETTKTASHGVVLTNRTSHFDSGVIGATLSWTTNKVDELNRVVFKAYSDGTSEGFEYGCCGVEAQTNRDGTVTSYLYTDEGRISDQISDLGGGLSIFDQYVYDGAGRLIKESRQGTNGVTILVGGYGYDISGRLVRMTNGLLYVTTNEYTVTTNGEFAVTTKYPDGSTTIDTRYADGSPKSRSGTAGLLRIWEHGMETNSGIYQGFEKEIRPVGGTNSAWVKWTYDGAGRMVRTMYPDGAAETKSYAPTGDLWKSVDADNNIILHTNVDFNTSFQLIDIDGDSAFDWTGPDRVFKTVRSVVTNASGFVVVRSDSYLYLTNDTPLKASTSERSADGLRSWSVLWNGADGVTNTTTTTHIPTNFTRIELSTAPDGTYARREFYGGRLLSEGQYSSADVLLTQRTYGYDAFNRVTSITDLRNGTRTLSYNDAGAVTSETTPLPGNGQSAQTTTRSYDALGRVWRIQHSDSTSTTNEYYVNGLLKRVSGSRGYPSGFGYDDQGRMTKMTNWTGFSTGTGARVTSWIYDAQRGWLTEKQYPDGKGPTFSYTAAGRMRTRTWERGVTVTNAYSGAGELSGKTYSDATSALTLGYDRGGRVVAVTNGNERVELIYNAAGLLITETNVAGVVSGLSMTNNFDSLLRRVGYGVPGQTQTAVSLGFDASGRVSSIANGDYSVAYGYVANSDMPKQIDFSVSSTTKALTVRKYDKLERLSSIETTASNVLPLSFTYNYDNANRRDRMTLNDGSFWDYQYDALGQVISGKRYWLGGEAVPGQQFEYGFDDIGNRTTSRIGGDSGGSMGTNTAYTVNSLNQYSERGVSGAFSVMGVGGVTNTILVNSAATYRNGEYFHKEITVDNTASAVYQSVMVSDGVNTNVTGSVFVQKTPELFTYDDDGNLTQDGRWNYTWDGENRLLRMESLSAAPTASKRKLEFQYDWIGRRIQRIVSTNSGSAYVAQSTNRFLYHGWNVVAEFGGNGALVQSFAWGLDLSGTFAGAGGVGGLLFVRPAGLGAHFVAYDGNGNVVGLYNHGSTNWAARYEYGPFGEPIRVSGTQAKTNPFRWSTKYTDGESGLVYYGYRYYSPSMGRWSSRDPIHEAGGDNVLAFSHNSPVNRFDMLGLCSRTMCQLSVLVNPLGDNRQHFETYDWDSVPPGDAFAYVGCGANWLNGKLRGLDGQIAIAGVPENNSDPDELEEWQKEEATKFGISFSDYIDSDQIPSAIDGAFEAAKKDALGRCARGCRKVKIAISCHQHATEDEQHYREEGDAKCGKATVYDCKTHDWSMLH